MATNKEFGIHFGALSDTLEKQIKKQGFVFDKRIVDNFQKQYDAIIRLVIGLLLPTSEGNKCEKRLYNKIVDHICKLNKVKINHLKIK